MPSSAEIIVWGCVAYIGAIVAATIASQKFRKDILGGSGKATIFGILSVTGAVLIILCGTLIAGAILAARLDFDSLNRAISVLTSNRELLEAQIKKLQESMNKSPALNATSKQETLPLVFKTTNQSVRPFCDAAGSPLPELVPWTNSAGQQNLALLVQSSASASSAINDFTGARHSISYLNDGWYNNCRSWIPLSMPAYAQIDLGADYSISSVVFGSEHSAHYKDRAATSFEIKVSRSDSPNSWMTVYSAKAATPVRNTTSFNFKPVPARFVRIDITESVGGEVRIDEVEVYGKSI